jgi:hypothetical protein
VLEDVAVRKDDEEGEDDDVDSVSFVVVFSFPFLLEEYKFLKNELRDVLGLILLFESSDGYCCCCCGE